MRSILLELRRVGRILRKDLGFTVVAVLTLALGIGASSAIFALVQGVLLTPPPYPKPEQIVLITPARTDGKPYAIGSGSKQWTAWRRKSTSFAGLSGYIWTFDFLVQAAAEHSGFVRQGRIAISHPGTLDRWRLGLGVRPSVEDTAFCSCSS